MANAPLPNLYATASTMHGLQVVVPDSDGDGRPERIKTGATRRHLSWMASTVLILVVVPAASIK